jgi:hypothetical protein
MLPPILSFDCPTSITEQGQKVSTGVQIDENLLALDVLDDMCIRLQEELQLARFKSLVNGKKSMKESLWKAYASLIPKIIDLKAQANEVLNQERKKCDLDMENSLEEMKIQHQDYNTEYLKRHDHRLKKELEEKEKLLQSIKRVCRKCEEDYEIQVIKAAKLTRLMLKNNLMSSNELLLDEMNMASAIINDLTNQINELQIKAISVIKKNDFFVIEEVDDTVETASNYVKESVNDLTTVNERSIDISLIQNDPRVLEAIQKNSASIELIKEHRRKISKIW